MVRKSEQAVLVVDDVPTMRQVIRSCLNQLGFYHVDEAADGEEALSLIRERNYAWVLSDWHMKPMGGPELMAAIREEFGEDAPRLVFVTMDGNWNVANTARDLGAVRLIVKPVRPSALKASIENVMSKAA